MMINNILGVKLIYYSGKVTYIKFITEYPDKIDLDIDWTAELVGYNVFFHFIIEISEILTFYKYLNNDEILKLEQFIFDYL